MNKIRKVVSLIMATVILTAIVPTIALADAAEALYKVVTQPAIRGYFNSSTIDDYAVVRESVYYVPATGETYKTRPEQEDCIWEPARVVKYSSGGLSYGDYYMFIGAFTAGGYAIARDVSGNEGIIDISGKAVVDFGKYDYIVSLSNDGYALVGKDEKRIVLNVKTGKETEIDVDSDSILSTEFGYGFIRILEYGDNGQDIYYFKNTKGENEFGKEYSYASGFENGYATVQTVGSDVYEIIDTSGKTVIVAPNNFVPGNVSEEGIFSIESFDHDSVGYMDLQGKQIYPSTLNGGRMFKNGFAVVYDQQGCGLIGANGKVIIPFGEYGSLTDTSGTNIVWAGGISDYPKQILRVQQGAELEPGIAKIVSLTPENGNENVEFKKNPGFQTFADIRVTFDRELSTVGTSEYADLNFNAGTVKVIRESTGEVILEAKPNSWAADMFDDPDKECSSDLLVRNKTSLYIKVHVDLLRQNETYYITVDEGLVNFKDGSVNDGIVEGEWRFKLKKTAEELTTSKDGEFLYDSQFSDNPSERYSYKYDESWFMSASDTYNHGLATMSLSMAMAAFDIGGNDRAANIKNLFDQLGYEYTNDSIHYPTPGTDTIGYAIGSKRVSYNDEVYTLIAVAIRGGGYGKEWASNFTLGPTSSHQGFDNAASEVVSAVREYIKNIGATSNIKVWITGYSRAAATTNLAAQRLNSYAKANEIRGLTKDNIFAYCFECPQTVQSDPSYENVDSNNNIFNIANCIDVVTLVAPTKWDYGRYGITMFVPSAEQTKNFSISYSKMQEEYRKILSKLSNPMDNDKTVVDTYTSFIRKQGAFLENVVNALTYVFYNKTVYVAGYQDEIRALAAGICSSSDFPVADILKAIVITYAIRHPVFAVATKEVVIDNVIKFGYAHYPELCLAWMHALDGKSEFADARTRRLKINCPVDVEVYDSGRNLVAKIVDNVPVDVADSTIVTYIDENEQMIVILPTDEEYTVELVATDAGTVTYTMTEHNYENGNTERMVSYYQVDVAKGDELTGKVENLDTTPEAKYPLYLNDETDSLTPTINLSDNEVIEHRIDVTSSGNGTVYGGGYFVSGEYALVSGIPDDGEKFLGWYVDGDFVSEENEYRFLVDGSHQVIGKFSTYTDYDYDVYEPTYSIGIPDIADGGTVVVTPGFAESGSTVKVTVTPYAGYALGRLAITTSNGNEVNSESSGDGIYTFTMPASDVTVKATFKKLPTPFADVPADAWYADSVWYAYYNDLFTGKTATTFAPGDTATRSEIATVLWRMADKPQTDISLTYNDVAPDKWYSDAVRWATDAGVVTGYDDGMFGPDDPVTREQFAAMLYRFAKYRKADVSVTGEPLSKFPDAGGTGDWAREAMAWAVDRGIINGSDGKLNPKGNAVRSQIAAMMERFAKLK